MEPLVITGDKPRYRYVGCVRDAVFGGREIAPYYIFESPEFGIVHITVAGFWELPDNFELRAAMYVEADTRTAGRLVEARASAPGERTNAVGCSCQL